MLVSMCARACIPFRGISQLFQDLADICNLQEEYKIEEELGKVKNCGHEYHVDCIKKWLLIKNACPICKAPALPDSLKEEQLTFTLCSFNLISCKYINGIDEGNYRDLSWNMYRMFEETWFILSSLTLLSPISYVSYQAPAKSDLVGKQYQTMIQLCPKVSFSLLKDESISISCTVVPLCFESSGFFQPYQSAIEYVLSWMGRVMFSPKQFGLAQKWF